MMYQGFLTVFRVYLRLMSYVYRFMSSGCMGGPFIVKALVGVLVVLFSNSSLDAVFTRYF